ncbi:hypothetical protein FPQ18DRAFT_326169 [Pyronema domesticum]|uniref:Fe2OG dioxygenase domain-containing protein n=1 Tax=Pyronema omphalodes (strain CBS 100304) TaxID=1076935 RepID=U4L0L0_PYROM|nr:hypothetical protein FPQ18DRAFT_326169 [Pyronema domesticum]CCX05569.1 Similar to hypothetical protein PTT_10192 [Pyrenophora teres f. teres 0-1]; acc. no. XP_003299242 [Pyronema omphalodes CBS 100304]
MEEVAPDPPAIIEEEESPPLPHIPVALPPTCSTQVLRLPVGFAMVIDDFLTGEECASLLQLAEATHSWEPALVNFGNGAQILALSARKCGRIIVDSHELADMLFQRIRPILEENEVAIIGADTKWRIANAPWKVTRINERLRFLRYKPGDYFRPHQDGHYFTPDETEQSFMTLQIYLGENLQEYEGGTTRFFFGPKEKITADIEPKQGRALVFQHRGLRHSGEPMKRGLKYAMRSDFMYTRKRD